MPHDLNFHCCSLFRRDEVGNDGPVYRVSFQLRVFNVMSVFLSFSFTNYCWYVSVECCSSKLVCLRMKFVWGVGNYWWNQRWNEILVGGLGVQLGHVAEDCAVRRGNVWRVSTSCLINYIRSMHGREGSLKPVAVVTIIRQMRNDFS